MITVVIVNYNSSKKLNKLISSLKKIDSIISEILIIDNNSDDLYGLLPSKKCHIIRNKKNIGFSKAVNLGISRSKTDIVLLTNPDSYLIDSSPLLTHKLIKNDSNIAIAGGKMLKEDLKTPYLTATSKPTTLTMLFEFSNLKKIFEGNIPSKKFWIERLSTNQKPYKVFSLCGAYMFIKKSCFPKNKKIFDERYFLYLEDLDLGYEVEKNKKIVMFDPRSKIVHIGGHSSNSRLRIVYKEWLKSRDNFIKKHFPYIEVLLLKFVYNIEQFALINYHYITHTSHD